VSPFRHPSWKSYRPTTAILPEEMGFTLRSRRGGWDWIRWRRIRGRIGLRPGVRLRNRRWSRFRQRLRGFWDRIHVPPVLCRIGTASETAKRARVGLERMSLHLAEPLSHRFRSRVLFRQRVSLGKKGPVRTRCPSVGVTGMRRSRQGHPARMPLVAIRLLAPTRLQ
jgi:hypothetical protein